MLLFAQALHKKWIVCAKSKEIVELGAKHF